MARGAPAIWLPALVPALSIALARITAVMMVFSNQIPIFLQRSINNIHFMLTIKTHLNMKRTARLLSAIIGTGSFAI